MFNSVMILDNQMVTVLVVYSRIFFIPVESIWILGQAFREAQSERLTCSIISGWLLERQYQITDIHWMKARTNISWR